MQEDKNKILAELKNLKSNKDYDSMLAAAQKAASLFPNEDKIFGFLGDAQSHYVDEKLNSAVVKELEQKGDWKTLTAVYQKLLKVFPDSKKLHKLLKRVKSKIDKGQIGQQKDQFLALKSQITNLVKEGRLDDALQACYEFLSNNPENEEIIHLQEKIENKRNKQIDKDLTKYFKESNPKLKEEYRADKEAFITV